MKIGVISDTHISKTSKIIPRMVLSALEKMDLILHAGDIIRMEVLHQLEQLAPVEAVAGNIDPPEIHQRLGNRKLLTLNKARIGLIHGHQGVGSNTPEKVFNAFKGESVDCIVFGHSHIPLIERRAGILLFNPGSPTDKRRQSRYSYGVLEVNEEITPRIVYFG